jgi:hypothetical protein
MCRSRPYQVFVFVGGVFAGTLSPQPMDSRSDGALSRVTLESKHRLSAEYLRYAPGDALCCPSHTTNVEFEVAENPPVVRPLSASTSPSASAGRSDTAAASLENTEWKLIRLDDTPIHAASERQEPQLLLNPESRRVSGSGGCNRLLGSYELTAVTSASARSPVP